MTTEMKATHTPTPWVVLPKDVNPFYKGIVALLAHHLLAPETGQIVAIGRAVDKPAFEYDANAEFIVRACNAHDDLVAACEGLLNYLSVIGYDEERHEVVQASAAIAKAKGETS